MRKTAWAAVLLVATATPAICASYDDLNAAISYFNREQYDNAITWFDKALAAGDLIPDHKRLAHLDRGLAYLTKSDASKAIADFTAAIAAQPRDLLAYRQRSATYLAIGDFENALSDYRELRRLRPQDYSILMNFGWLSWQLGKIEDSANAFAIFSNVETNSWAWLQLANIRLGRSITGYNEGGASQKWPGHLIRFFQGNLSEVDVLQAAKAEDQECAGYSYAGLWRVVHSDKSGAAALLKTAFQKCGENSPYGRIARTALDSAAQAGTK